MSRKRSTQVAFSLFSFQDIITSVTGIMILITLILALELVSRVQSAPAYQTEQQQDVTRETIEDLRRQLAELEQSADNSSEVDIRGLPSLDPGELHRRTEALQQSAASLEDQIEEARKRAAEKAQEADSARREAAADADAAQEEIRRIEQAIADAKAKLAEIKGRGRIYFKPGHPEVTTWLVEAKEASLLVAQLGVSAVPRTFTLIQEFDLWARDLDPAQNDFLLIVKPGGENRADKCKQLLRDPVNGRGFHVGLQVMPDDRVVIDPETGAGA